ncbi:hypothetical protein [Pararhodospirillum oryzae]|uniref:hypothetical protein n=1 Tax=Pararhodospirillum oryzae TaxID=478448 RepID=UPI0014780A48|nr:hypothetical protein [Pararhodospirillum oryzae]
MARLSAGEYVVNAAATARHRDLVRAINDNDDPALARAATAWLRGRTLYPEDDRLAHITQGEIDFLVRLGASGRLNPVTGLPQLRFGGGGERGGSGDSSDSGGSDGGSANDNDADSDADSDTIGLSGSGDDNFGGGWGGRDDLGGGGSESRSWQDRLVDLQIADRRAVEALGQFGKDVNQASLSFREVDPGLFDRVGAYLSDFVGSGRPGGFGESDLLGGVLTLGAGLLAGPAAAAVASLAYDLVRGEVDTQSVLGTAGGAVGGVVGGLAGRAIGYGIANADLSGVGATAARASAAQAGVAQAAAEAASGAGATPGATATAVAEALAAVEHDGGEAAETLRAASAALTEVAGTAPETADALARGLVEALAEVAAKTDGWRARVAALSPWLGEADQAWAAASQTMTEYGDSIAAVMAEADDAGELDLAVAGARQALETLAASNHAAAGLSDLQAQAQTLRAEYANLGIVVARFGGDASAATRGLAASLETLRAGVSGGLVDDIDALTDALGPALRSAVSGYAETLGDLGAVGGTGADADLARRRAALQVADTLGLEMSGLAGLTTDALVRVVAGLEPVPVALDDTQAAVATLKASAGDLSAALVALGVDAGTAAEAWARHAQAVEASAAAAQAAADAEAAATAAREAAEAQAEAAAASRQTIADTLQAANDETRSATDPVGQQVAELRRTYAERQQALVDAGAPDTAMAQLGEWFRGAFGRLQASWSTGLTDDMAGLAGDALTPRLRALADERAERWAAAQALGTDTGLVDVWYRMAVAAAEVETAEADRVSTLEDEAQALTDVAGRWRSVAESLRALPQDLALDDTLSPLSTRGRYDEARAQLEANVAAARALADGPEDARLAAAEAVGDALRTFLAASRGYNQSSEAYGADYRWALEVSGDMADLADAQASAADAQVAAIQAQTGQLSTAISAGTAALATQLADQAAATRGLAEAMASRAGTFDGPSGGFTSNPYSSGGMQGTRTDAQVATWFRDQGYGGDWGGGAALNWAESQGKMAAYLRYIGGYAAGGWVGGPGGGTDDATVASLSAGEYVVNAASARAYAPVVEAANAGTLRVVAPPDPVVVPFPAPGGGEREALLAPLLREVIGRLERVEAAIADGTSATRRTGGAGAQAVAEQIAGLADRLDAAVRAQALATRARGTR